MQTICNGDVTEKLRQSSLANAWSFGQKTFKAGISHTSAIYTAIWRLTTPMAFYFKQHNMLRSTQSKKAQYEYNTGVAVFCPEMKKAPHAKTITIYMKQYTKQSVCSKNVASRPRVTTTATALNLGIACRLMLDIAVPHAKNVYEGNPTRHKALA